MSDGGHRSIDACCDNTTLAVSACWLKGRLHGVSNGTMPALYARQAAQCKSRLCHGDSRNRVRNSLLQKMFLTPIRWDSHFMTHNFPFLAY